MRTTRTTISLLTVALGMLLPLQALADVPAEMKILEQTAGTWKLEQTTKTADGREVKATGRATAKMILGGRYLEYYTVTNPGAQEVYLLFTYDESRQKFRSWFFNSAGQHSYWSGTWDAATKTLTRTADLGRGNTGKSVTRSIDDNTTEFSLVGKHGDGRVFVELNSTMTRQPDAEPVVRKASKQRAETPLGLSMLDKLIGKWQDTGVVKPAVWTPEETRFDSASERSWMLGGTCTFHETEDALFVTTYSATENAVKMWHFNAAGYVHEWTGGWNDAGDVLTLKSDLDGNPPVSSVLTQTFDGNDENTWNAIASDRDGKVYHHIEGRSVRRR